MTKAPILELCDIRFGWPGRLPFSLSLPKLAVAPGETVLLLGESGSGKSTLLSLVCGTVLAQYGAVRVAGSELAQMPGGARDQFRAEHFGVIFQQFNLLPFGTVLDNILLPLRFAPTRRARVGDGRIEATHICTALGLPPSVVSARAASLSVGQQQRVAVARALIGHPPIILADEPTSALDEASQATFLDLLFAQVKANETTLLMVSHDARLAERFDRCLRIEDIARIERQAA